MTPVLPRPHPQDYPDSTVCGSPRRVAGEDAENGVSFSMVVPCGTSSQEAVERFRQTFNLQGDNTNYRLWNGNKFR